ncbi:MAG: SUMF1/EgtB/PvdO family nonheme iron enzyme, partial [Actinobacteria bacterium]|nr:SUMF1/EgtB/PvdO family nonheme iron enzyme [Actinomycetota bacterium]
MASAITLEGIDQAISNLRYKNKNTLKYRFVGHIRQYYTKGDSVELVSEVDHAELIKILWDTDDSLEAIKNKRKNLNSVRSSVNADLKKLYEKGENPEGLKIGSSNIFVMSGDAKDKILKKLAYDLQPDGTLKLDQIMDILKLANETVSGSMAVEDTEKKDGLKKIDQLKDLIKGLSEKVGLGSPELSKAAPEAGDMAGKGDEQGSGSMGMDEVLEDSEIDTVEAVEDIEDLEEVAEDDILEDIEDVEVDEIVDTDTDDLVEAAEIDEDLEDVSDVDEDVEDVAEVDILDDIEDVEVDEIVDTDSDDLVEEGDGKKEDEQLGLPVGSLGQEYSIEADSKIKKNKLLAEEFDGYLGSMDRYYNHYILIPEGEYLIGSKQTKKDEKPEQIVFLELFYFSRFPITNGLFEIFVEKTGYKTTAEKVGYGTVYFGRFKKKKDEITGLITSTWNSSLYCKTVEG